jgi:hypothetical protein
MLRLSLGKSEIAVLDLVVQVYWVACLPGVEAIGAVL